MQRVLEPELMEEADASQAYADADFSDSVTEYVRGLLRHKRVTTYLDVGCGPGHVAIELARSSPQAHIVALDGSQAMIDIASTNIQLASEQDSKDYFKQIQVVNQVLQDYGGRQFDAVISKDSIHHIPDIGDFLALIARTSRNGTLAYHMDLIRPESEEEARRIVETVAGNEHPLLKTDFYNSLLAGHTIPEVQAHLAKAGLSLEIRASNTGRHYIIEGILKK